MQSQAAYVPPAPQFAFVAPERIAAERAREIGLARELAAPEALDAKEGLRAFRDRLPGWPPAIEGKA